jgi:hypothetical protein
MQGEIKIYGRDIHHLCNKTFILSRVEDQKGLDIELDFEPIYLAMVPCSFSDSTSAMGVQFDLKCTQPCLQLTQHSTSISSSQPRVSHFSGKLSRSVNNSCCYSSSRFSDSLAVPDLR